MKKRGKELHELETSLAEYKGEDRMVASREVYEELKNSPQKVFQANLGVPFLDKKLEGVEAGELIIVTGPTGEGKTTLLMSITKNMANAGEKSAWFTLEVTPRQFIHKITYGITDETKIPLFYLPAKNLENHIDWIEQRIIEAKVKYHIKAVFIDHIHQIFSLAQIKYGNVSLELGDLVAKIKDIALTHNLVIFLIAHTKDDPQGSTTKEPTKESIRDSGLISRLADTIIAVWRIKTFASIEEAKKAVARTPIGEDDTWAKVRILKNRRNGNLGTTIMEHKDHSLTEAEDNF
jgi:replicative DNA helicase